MNKTTVEIKEGIKTHFIKTDLYKTDLTCIIITTPLKRDTVTKNALIPFFLRQGTKKYPSQSLLNKKMEDMYGASFNCGIDKMGDNVVLKFYIESISNEYALNNEDVLRENIESLLDIVFDPVQNGDLLNEEILELEKEKAAKAKLKEKEKAARAKALQAEKERPPNRVVFSFSAWMKGLEPI